jgi:cell division transport system permease protein
MGARFRYLASEVGLGLRRNLLITIATVVTVTVSLALLGAGLLVQSQVSLAQDLFYGEVEISIWLEDDISESQRVSLENSLRENPEVSTVLYESKEDAYAQAQEIFSGQEEVLASIEPDFLPASFRVGLVDPERYFVVESQYLGSPGVAEISDQRDVLERLFSIMDVFRNGAFAVAVLQLVAAAALISNTIRITAFARRQQIGIMKLVGATNWYIRLPFVLEGVIAGVVGALLASGLLFVGQRALLGRLQEQVVFMPFIGTGAVLEVVPVLVLVGGGLAAIASILSLRRFLSV